MSFATWLGSDARRRRKIKHLPILRKTSIQREIRREFVADVFTGIARENARGATRTQRWCSARDGSAPRRFPTFPPSRAFGVWTQGS
jgi:hypothetical protein